MSKEWEGNERRSGNITLWDVLLEVREVNNNLAHLKVSFDGHLKDDNDKFEQIRKDVKWTQGIAIAAVTIVGVFQFLVSSGAIDIHGLFASDNYSSRTSYNDDNFVGKERRVSRESVST